MSEFRCMACGQFVSAGEDHQCPAFEEKHIEAWAKIKRLVKEFSVVSEDFPDDASDSGIRGFFSDPLIQSKLYAIAVEKKGEDEEGEEFVKEMKGHSIFTKTAKALMKLRTERLVKEMNLGGFSLNHVSRVIAEQISDELGRRVSSKAIFKYLKELEEKDDV